MSDMLSPPQRKLLHMTERLRKWLYGAMPMPAPPLVEISPTAVCNASCPWCFYSGKQSGEMIDSSAMLEALTNMAEFGVRAVNWTGGGEPTLHEGFNSFVAHAKAIGLKQGLFTNALSPSHEVEDPGAFSWIRISLTDEYLLYLSPARVQRYAEATRVGICLNLTAENARFAKDIALAARGMGCSYFQVRPALERYWKDQVQLPVPEDLRELATPEFRVSLSEYKFVDCCRPKPYHLCYGGTWCPSIDYRGDVRWCNYHFDRADRTWGNIGDAPFDEIFQRLPQCCPVLLTCQNECKHHEINKVLYELQERCEDPEFI
jgi:MoaA/NifB/PqqE/SkfB family radical SAM enzyme